jgi:hypothetical protein
MEHVATFTKVIDMTKIESVHKILLDIHAKANEIKQIDPNFNFQKYLADCF